jgi:DNA-binding MarR family transcriptional regulator
VGSREDTGAGAPDKDVLTLARLARLLERACTDLAPPLTLAQYRLLAMIGGGAERASEIAGRLALTKPTVSATVDTLVERGLIARGVADDRRALRLQLTAEGHTALQAAERAMRARLDDVLARVDDRVTVTRALATLADGLDERRQERRAARERL